jgi:arsenite oxidase large subunit
MLFGHPRGAAGDLVSDHVDPKTTSPYCKGASANIARVGPKPTDADRVSFLPRNIAE